MTQQFTLVRGKLAQLPVSKTAVVSSLNSFSELVDPVDPKYQLSTRLTNLATSDQKVEGSNPFQAPAFGPFVALMSPYYGVVQPTTSKSWGALFALRALPPVRNCV